MNLNFFSSRVLYDLVLGSWCGGAKMNKQTIFSDTGLRDPEVLKWVARHQNDSKNALLYL